MEHAERRRWCREISAINEKMNHSEREGAGAERTIDLRQLV